MTTTTTTSSTTTALSPSDLKTLEQTRQRLSHLTTSLASLQAHILNSDPLPPWSSLHSHLLILLQPLTSLASHLSPSSPLTSDPTSTTTNHTSQPPPASPSTSTQIYPLPTFPTPASAHEGLLSQLLRKKLEPGVEGWVADGLAMGQAGVVSEGGEEEIKGLWEWAGVRANEVARGVEWGGGDTGGEGGVSDGEEEEEGGDGGKGEGKGEKEGEGGRGEPMRVESVLRFVVRGEVAGGGGMV